MGDGVEKKRSRRCFFFPLCDVATRGHGDGPALPRKNKVIWWARYLEHLLRASSLAKSITLNSPNMGARRKLFTSIDARYHIPPLVLSTVLGVACMNHSGHPLS